MDRQPLSKAQPCKDARAFGLLHPTAPKPRGIGVEIGGLVTLGKLYGAFGVLEVPSGAMVQRRFGATHAPAFYSDFDHGH